MSSWDFSAAEPSWITSPSWDFSVKPALLSHPSFEGVQMDASHLSCEGVHMDTSHQSCKGSKQTPFTRPARGCR